MKVLLAVDGSTFTRRMLDHLAAHPDLLGKVDQFVALTVVSALPSHPASFVGREVVNEYYRDQAEEVLAPVRAFAQERQWPLETRFASGSHAEAIARLANSGEFALLVMGTHGHSPLGGLVMGSVTARVISLTQLPVLLIR